MPHLIHSFRATQDQKIMSESVMSPNFIELTADIASAYVSNNSVQAAELPALLAAVHGALAQTGRGQREVTQAE